MTARKDAGQIIFHFPLLIFHWQSVAGGVLCRARSSHKGEPHGDSDLSLNPLARADELEDRLIEFGVRIVKLSARLPRTLQENTLRDKF